MGYHRHGSMSDWEFLRAAQIEQRETETAHDVVIKQTISLASPRSVIELRAEAWEIAEGGGDRQLCAYSHEWPSSKVETFGAAVFQTLVRLTRLVEDCRRDEALIGAKRQ